MFEKYAMTDRLTIRDAVGSDVELLSDLIRRSFRDVADRFDLTLKNCPKHPSNCTGEWVRTDLERGVRYFIGSVDNESVGCVALERASPDVCYLERLAVVPQWRGRGYGAALTQHCLREAELTRVPRVQIGIIADQTELTEWYARLGFRSGETVSFDHLPFRVTFMDMELPRSTSDMGS
jgi:N-acetylglutamate synthase-like GNAT family acetyltransferase